MSQCQTGYGEGVGSASRGRRDEVKKVDEGGIGGWLKAINGGTQGEFQMLRLQPEVTDQQAPYGYYIYAFQDSFPKPRDIGWGLCKEEVFSLKVFGCEGLNPKKVFVGKKVPT